MENSDFDGHDSENLNDHRDHKTRLTLLVSTIVAACLASSKDEEEMQDLPGDEVIDNEDDTIDDEMADDGFDPQGIADRVLDNLGLRSTLPRELSDEVLRREFPPLETAAAGGSNYGQAGTRSATKPLVVSTVEAGVFGTQLSTADQLVARTSIQQPQAGVSRLVTEIVLPPRRTPIAGAYIVAAFTVVGRAVPVRVPLTLTDHALPGKPSMYALTGSASLLRRDVGSVAAITAVSLELAKPQGRR